MIPRHRPEFGVADLIRAIVPTAEPDLSSVLPRELGRTHGWWTPSGRAALAVALEATGARRAVVPAFNCWAVMEALQRARVEPVFVDVGDDLNPDVDQSLDRVQRAGPETVLLLTHQFGIPMASTAALIDVARAREVPIVEDAAAAIGARTDAGPAGSNGTASVLSFQYTKSVFAGDGGLLLTSGSFADRIRPRVSTFRRRGLALSKREWIRLLAIGVLTHPSLYGWSIHRWLPPEGTFNERGAQAPMRAFQTLPSTWMRRLAARTWRRVDTVLESRRRLARRYLEGLADHPVGMVPKIATEDAAPIRFPMFVKDRASFIERCATRGLDLGRSFAYTCSDGAGFPRAERVAASIVNLPLTARLAGRADRVVEIVAQALLAGRERGISDPRAQ